MSLIFFDGFDYYETSRSQRRIRVALFHRQYRHFIAAQWDKVPVDSGASMTAQLTAIGTTPNYTHVDEPTPNTSDYNSSSTTG